jgi:hypothetical protein
MANNQSITKGSCFCKLITYQFEGEPVTKVRIIPSTHTETGN